jgi:flagellar motility protein MotE (MotC chaperone)
LSPLEGPFTALLLNTTQLGRFDLRQGEFSMIKFSVLPRALQRAASITAICSVLTVAACATTPPEPTVALKAAEQAIATADRTRIADAASPELREAREKLTAAQAAVQNKKLKDRMIVGERLALESRVDAELATARNEAAKAQAVNDEIKQSTAILSQEMQRNTGAK